MHECVFVCVSLSPCGALGILPGHRLPERERRKKRVRTRETEEECKQREKKNLLRGKERKRSI